MLIFMGSGYGRVFLFSSTVMLLLQGSWLTCFCVFYYPFLERRDQCQVLSIISSFFWTKSKICVLQQQGSLHSSADSGFFQRVCNNMPEGAKVQCNCFWKKWKYIIITLIKADGSSAAIKFIIHVLKDWKYTYLRAGYTAQLSKLSDA